MKTLSSTVLAVLVGFAACSVIAPAVVAQDADRAATDDPIGELRAAAAAGDQDATAAILADLIATADPELLFEAARLQTMLPTEYVLPSTDFPRAMALLRRVVDLLEGRPGRDTRRLLQRAQVELANVELRTATRAEQLVEARDLLEEAAQSGYGRAALRLGEGLATGEFGTVDDAASVRWLRRALANGINEAALVLSEQLHRAGGETADEEEGLTRLGLASLRRGALEGDVDQAVTLATAYMHHPVVPQDLEQAGYWLQFAVERGNVQAMVELAALLTDSAYGEPDPDAARGLLIAAAAEGSTNAAVILARTLLQRGDSSFSIDPEVARMWLDRAVAVREPRGLRIAAGLAVEGGDADGGRALLQQAAVLGDVYAGIDLISVLVAAGDMERAILIMGEMEQRVAISNQGAVGLADIKLAGDPGSPLFDPQGALDLLHVAAQRGDGGAFYRLGELQAEGRLVESDPGLAADNFRESADRGYFPGMLRMVEAYTQGEGVEQSPALAADWLNRVRAAARRGSTDDMVALGRALLQGMIGQDNAPEGITWLQLAADRGNPRAMVSLAGAYLNGSAGSFDPERALALYESAVGAGDQEANYYVGRAYATGIGAAIDQRAALEYFQAAAAAGSAAAATELGLIYSSGGDVPVDLQVSYAWLRRAADAGHVTAMIYMSNLIAVGAYEGVTDETAVSWLKRAASTGDPDAQFQLAVALKRGLLGEVDLEAAERWMREAADNGHFQARAELQRMIQAHQNGT